jgi:hypothetical protein
MPERKTTERAKTAKRQGKAPSTQAGEFVKDEVDRVRKGEHGVKSSKQAVAIGLSKARRAGVDLKPPAKGKSSEATRKKAGADLDQGSHATSSTSPAEHEKRSKAATDALKREGKAGASPKAMSRQGHAAASRRSAADPAAPAKKGAATKGAAGRAGAAHKGAQTRAARAAH